MRAERKGAAANDDAFEPVLGGFAYLVLAIIDLATTTVLLRAYPGAAAEANALLAGVIETHGFQGLWAVKLTGAFVGVLLYLGVRRKARQLADGGLVASCVIQAAIVLVNLAAFVALAA